DFVIRKFVLHFFRQTFPYKFYGFIFIVLNNSFLFTHTDNICSLLLIESVVLFLIFNLNLKTTIQKISSTSTWDFRENLLCNLKKRKIRKKIVKSLTQEKLIEFVRLLADSTKIKLEIKIEDS